MEIMVMMMTMMMIMMMMMVICRSKIELEYIILYVVIDDYNYKGIIIMYSFNDGWPSIGGGGGAEVIYKYCRWLGCLLPIFFP